VALAPLEPHADRSHFVIPSESRQQQRRYAFKPCFSACLRCFFCAVAFGVAKNLSGESFGLLRSIPGCLTKKHGPSRFYAEHRGVDLLLAYERI